MYRHPNSNYECPPYTPQRPMFTRHLNVVGSSWSPTAQAPLGWWRSPYLFNPSWWTGQPPWPQQTHHSQNFLFNARNPGAQGFGTWQQANPGFFFAGYQRALHLSQALMDDAKKEPPHKRRRSSDEESQNSPSRLPAHKVQGRGSPNRIRNGPSPEKIQTGLPKTGQPAEIKRQWEDFSDLYKHRSKSCDGQPDRPFDFSVMSYNILSQQLLQDNAYLYKHCHSSILDWNHRFPSILKELAHHNADILCLQEVQEDHYQKQLKPSLESLGYQCEYKRRTGWKSDGCAVSFKRDRFSLVSQHPVEYFRRGVPTLDRDNVGLVLLLQPAGPPPESGGVVCVANTHLLYNPRRGDVKLAQLAVLLAEITPRVPPAGGRRLSRRPLRGLQLCALVPPLQLHQGRPAGVRGHPHREGVRSGGQSQRPACPPRANLAPERGRQSAMPVREPARARFSGCWRGPLSHREGKRRGSRCSIKQVSFTSGFQSYDACFWRLPGDTGIPIGGMGWIFLQCPEVSSQTQILEGCCVFWFLMCSCI
ncbi:hypothetical protein SKAU_G00186110 [Synaphobranchus kaupii]|uniref:Endonuclease/exonuclease/phosphatase domain-containing protein n=1 Tax=Synaphobranchus kaupii TaxID=118154 RepID=A0A9Q1FCS5_SYNKA|nr:hypothetical protein SKAU_G00186110 [Synaphobranchus kaupii]